MAEDIVPRLREEPCGETWCDQCRIYSEAADEIERLRKEVDNLRAENQRLSQIARY